MRTTICAWLRPAPTLAVARAGIALALSGLALAALAFLGLGLAARPAAAQQQLVSRQSASAGPVYETWRFSDVLYQPTLAGDSVGIERVTQWSVPIAVDVPIGSRWSVSLSSAYASGEVALASADASLGAERYALSGLTDVRLRATGRVVGDGVLLTLGLNVPTGPTSLDPAQLSALRVLAAPALGLQPAAVGTGLAGTSGIVLARTLGDWAWALGASYELRGTYAPVAAFIAGTAEPDFDPGDALHLSLGTDGFLGRHGLTVGVSADFYTEDKLTTGNAGSEATVQLGPIVTAEAQLRLAAGGLRDLTFYAVERYRSSFKRAGETARGSSGHYAEAGLRGVVPAGRSVGIVAALHGRYHTGLEVDNTLATAAVRTGGATLGVAFDLGRSGTLQPFVRGQLGTIETGGRRADARGIAAGVVLGVRP